MIKCMILIKEEYYGLGGFIMSKMIKCKTCNAEIASSAKKCPSCGAKNKKPIYKKWWFWVLAVIVVGSIAGGAGNSESSNGGGLYHNLTNMFG